MCVKWGFDNNKKHTKEGHDNPRLFIASYKRVKCMVMFKCSIPRQCIFIVRKIQYTTYYSLSFYFDEVICQNKSVFLE